MFNWTSNYYNNDDNTSRKVTDLDYVFGIHPISKDISKKNNIETIKQSIRTLVMLNHYEKPFHPDIGCDILKSMFEPFEEEFTNTMMRKHIHNVVDNYEPRALLEQIDVNVEEDQNFLNITIWFTPINETEMDKVDIFLKILR